MTKIDIKFIANQAGVSPATVSRVLNGSKYVRPELAERVMAVVEKYQYSPNLTARSLVSHKSRLIGIVTPKVSTSFHAELISEIEKSTDGYGYDVIVSNISGCFAQEEKTFQMMRERQVDGVILLHENTAEEMTRLETMFPGPIVLASVRCETADEWSVTIDDYQAAHDATRAILDAGHRAVSGVFSDSYSGGTLRRAGFLAALQEAGLEPVSVLHSDCTVVGGESAARTIFANDSAPHPTAIFFVSDEMAIGALRALRELGRSLPDDVSVVGFDDIEMSGYVTPRLTTIHQPIAQIGQRATQLLMQLLNGETPELRQVVLPHSVVYRDSLHKLSG